MGGGDSHNGHWSYVDSGQAVNKRERGTRGSEYMARRRTQGVGVGVDGEKKGLDGRPGPGLGKGTPGAGRSVLTRAGVEGPLASARLRDSRLGELELGEGTGGVETLGPASETGVGNAPGTGPDEDDVADTEQGRKRPWLSQGSSVCLFLAAIVGREQVTEGRIEVGVI